MWMLFISTRNYISGKEKKCLYIMKVPETSISTIILPEKISPSPVSTWTKRKICGWELPVTDFTVYRETKRFPNPSQEVILRVFTKIRLKNYGSVLGKKDSTG